MTSTPLLFTNPLADFDDAVADFKATTEEIDTYLSRGTEVRPLIRYRAAIAASDIVASCNILRQAHLAAVAESLTRTRHAAQAPKPIVTYEEMQEIGSDMERLGQLMKERFTPEKQAESMAYLREMGAMMQAAIPITNDFRIVYKSLFYFIRVYQDVLYQLLNNLLGERSPTGSMSSALAANNPVGQMLREQADGYPDWFADWRNKRNAVKYGVNFSIAGPDMNLGVGFSSYDEATNGLIGGNWEDAVRLGDIASALRQCQRIIQMVASQVERQRPS